MNSDAISSTVRTFIINQSGIEDPAIIEEDTDLFEAGLLDSLVTAALVTFCEEEFQCELDLSDLTEDNLRSIHSISQFIADKLGRVGAH